MQYISTRGAAPELEFDDVLLTGLARDGGLYLPKVWPRFSEVQIRAMAGLSYVELATRIMAPFLVGNISEKMLCSMLDDAYRCFDHAAVAPLKQLDKKIWLMELFHGPTLAFKDYAMQILSPLFDYTLRHRGKRVTLLGATSGDTGSAAIEAFRGSDSIDIFILFPEGRVSPIQQKQMTTVEARNVHAIALKGTFDDCQDMVKNLFNDLEFRDRHRLTAVNSINWARLLPQIVYYFWSALSLGAPDRSIVFSIPSGNFGNVFSAYAAKALGLPIERLIIATNANDILSRFFHTGTMKIDIVKPSLSPSMDIQVSSNFERLLFDLFDRDDKATSQALLKFRKEGSFSVSQAVLDKGKKLFEATAVNDLDTLQEIHETYLSTGELLDPHSAIGVKAAKRMQSLIEIKSEAPIVSLACAHPAKFPEAVSRATGLQPPLPPKLSDLLERKEHISILPNDFATVAGYIAAHTGAQEIKA